MKTYALRGVFPVLLCICSLLSIGQTHVQTATLFQTTTATTISKTFATASTAGNLIVVHLDWDGQTRSISSVTDNKGNSYSRINGPTNWNGASYRAELWYAYNITAGGTPISVSATLSAVPTTFSQIYISEYSGINIINPLDQNSVAIGSATAVSSGAASTTQSKELIYGASIGASGLLTTGSGFTNCSTANQNIIETKIVSATGSYNSAFTSAGGNWIAQMASFIAATSISTGTITGSPFCAGTAFSVPYTITGTFTSGNVFTAQLSDANGSFASPVTIGSTTSTSAGTISGTIPVGVAGGSDYRIRVMASMPLTIGTDNGSNITINAFPTATSGNPQAICQNGSATISGATASNGSILWTENGSGSITSGATTLTPTYTPASSDGGHTVTLTMTVTGNGACNTKTATAATLITVNKLPASPNISKSGSTTFCAGGSVTLTSSSGITYLWSTGETTPGITTSVSGNYSVQVTDVNGCQSTPSNATAVIVNTLPIISSQPSAAGQTLCVGSAATPLSVTASATNIKYQWYSNTTNSNTGGISMGGGLAQTATYTPGTSNAGTLYYYVVVSGTCSPSDTSDVSGAVTVNALPTTTDPSNVNQTVCANNSAPTLSVSATGVGITYQWYMNTTNSNSGGTLISGATSSSHTPSTPVAGKFYYYVVVSGVCSPAATSHTSGSYTILAQPTAAITGNASFCAGNSTLLSSNATAGSGNISSYQWNLGGSPISGATSSTYSATAAGSYTVTVTNSNGCSYTSTAFTVSVNALPTITGNGSVCIGSTTQLTGSGTPAASNPWVSGSPAFATISNTGLVTGISLGSSVITYTSSNGCSITSLMAASPVPVTTGVTICQGGVGTLSALACTAVGSTLVGPKDPGSIASGSTNPWGPTSNVLLNDGLVASSTMSGGKSTAILSATNYGFSIPATAVITGVQVTVGKYANGNMVQDTTIQLIVGGNPSGNNYTITTSKWPTTLTTFTYGSLNDLWGNTLTPAIVNASNFGVAIACTNMSGPVMVAYVDYIEVTLTYAMPGTLNWYTVSSGGSPIGSGSPFNPAGVSGSGLANTNTPGTSVFYAECSSVPGCRTSANFIINTVPTASITGTASFCAGSNTLLMANATAGSGTIASYQWNLGGTPVSGATSATYSATAGGSYTVKVTNSNGCATTSAAKVLTANALPTANITGNVSFCTGSSTLLNSNATAGSGTISGYQWNLGGTTISGATSSTYAAMAGGSYTVTVTNSNGCATTSAASVITANALPAAPTASVMIQPTCALATGTIHITAPTGSGITYSADGINYVNASGLFPGMVPGTYSLTARNSSGCISPVTNVTVNAAPSTPAAPTVSVTAQPTCSIATGTITITAPTGSGMTYSTDGVTYTNTTGVFNGMTPGTYSVKAKNSSGCISSGTNVTVNAQPPVLTGNLSGSQAICSGSSAVLTIAATGAGTLSGTLSDGTTFSGTAPLITVNVSPVTTTTYTIAILTNGTCAASGTNKTGSATVTVSAVPFATISYAGNPFCNNTGNANVTLTGTTGGTFTASPAGANINAVNGIVNLASSIAGSYTVTYSVAASGGCATFSTTTPIVVNPNTWIGTVSTNWNTPGNWAAAYTNACPVVTITNKRFPAVLTSGTVTLHDLVIQSGASLTLSNSTLQISGTIYNSGTLDAGNGTIEMNGSSAQTIAANTFFNNAVKDLVISNTSAGGVSLAGPVDIYNSLTFTGTGKVLNTNDSLTFKSNATGTAYLGNMTGNTINGKATVERYLSARKGWRLLSIPTNTDQTIQQTWQEGCGANGNCVAGFGTQITGAGGTAAGFDAASPSPSMKKYNPANNTWVGVPNTNATTIKATDGYMVFVRGDRSVTTVSGAPTPTVVRTKGSLYVGDQPAITVAASQFAAIGNPYPSAIDMRNITKTGLKDFFYLWDPMMAGTYGYGAYQTFSNDGNGNYVVTPGGGSYGASGGVSNYIQSGLAFFVQATASGGSITLKEGAKTSGSSLVSVPSTAPVPSLRVNILGVNADKSTYLSDGFLVNYGDNYSNAVDDMDAIKSTNTSENLAVKEAGKLLVIERKQTIQQQDTIQFNLSNVQVMNYQFQVIANSISRPGLTAFLVDNYLKTSTPLNIDGTTTINFNIANIAGSYAANRFMIVFTPTKALPVTFTSIIAYLQGSGINVQWNVDNESNMKQYEVEKSIDGNTFTTLAITPAASNNGGSAIYQVHDSNPGQGYNYYRVKSLDINGQESYTQIVKVQYGITITSDITVYPNPIKSGIINLKMTNEPAGLYQVRIVDQLGQPVLYKKIMHIAGSSSEMIMMDNNRARGVYQVEVTSPNNESKVIQIVY